MRRLDTVEPFGSWPDFPTLWCACLQCANCEVDAARTAQPFETTSPHQRAPYPDVQHPEHMCPTVELNSAPEPGPIPSAEPDRSPVVSAAQTHTPPEEALNATMPSVADDVDNAEDKTYKKHQGWPKGKPRGPRAGVTGGKKKRSTPKPKSAPSSANSSIPDQLHSPQSLPAEQNDDVQTEGARPASPYLPLSRELTLQTRRHSFSNASANELESSASFVTYPRSQSVPPDNSVVTMPQPSSASRPNDDDSNDATQTTTICSGCHSSDSLATIGEGEQWISCDGCKGWYHFACAGFKSEREVRDVDKYYCKTCSPKYGHTTSQYIVACG
jgi:F-box/leucine-rich repeat protein 10/11